MKENAGWLFLFWSPFCLVTVRMQFLLFLLLPANPSPSSRKQQWGDIVKGDVPGQEDKGQCHVATNLSCNKEQLWMSCNNVYSKTAHVTLTVCSILIWSSGSNCVFLFSCDLLHTYTWHSIWDWCNDLVLSWLISVNGLLLLYLDSKLISMSLL